MGKGHLLAHRQRDRQTDGKTLTVRDRHKHLSRVREYIKGRGGLSDTKRDLGERHMEGKRGRKGVGGNRKERQTDRQTDRQT